MNTVKLKEESKHWKDKMSGWHAWEISTLCKVCDKITNDVLCGTKDQAHKYAENLICEECLDDYVEGGN